MRITDAMRIGQLISDLDSVRTRLARVQQEAASGRRIQRPSDDPVGAATALRLRTRLDEIDRYLDSARQAADWVAATEEGLASAEQVLATARDVVLMGANASLPPAAREALAAELDALIDELVQIGNSVLDGRYLFAGHKTTQPPFARPDANTVEYKGDLGLIERTVGPGASVTVNVPGRQVFGDSSGGAFASLIDARDRIRAGDVEGLTAVSLPAVDRALDQLRAIRTTIGAQVERLEREEARLRSFKVYGAQALSAVEDADLAEVVLRLGEAEAAYRAALAVGARIIQPTLIDFLR